MLKRIVRELCVSMLHSSSVNRSEENTQPQTPRSFVSVSLASASESGVSPSLETRHRSMLGTVRLPRANSEDKLPELNSRSSNSGSGSDVPSQTTSDDDGSIDTDIDEVRTKV